MSATGTFWLHPSFPYHACSSFLTWGADHLYTSKVLILESCPALATVPTVDTRTCERRVRGVLGAARESGLLAATRREVGGETAQLDRNG